MFDAPSGQTPNTPLPKVATPKTIMSTPSTSTAGQLPDYIASAQPNPPSNRAPWFKNTAPTYAGIFLWFVFWDSIATKALLAGGLWPTLLGILLGALICHLPLLPGARHPRNEDRLAALRRGNLDVRGDRRNGDARSAHGRSSVRVARCQHIRIGRRAVERFQHAPGLYIPLCILWAVGAAFVGLKGIQYVAKVATFLPLIPLAVLILGLVLFGGSALQPASR